MCVELAMINDNVRKPLVWYLLKQGIFVSFMEALNGHDENYSMQFANSWENCKVTINGILFHVSEEVIVMVTGMAMRGRKWQKVTHVINETSLQCFFKDGEELVWHKGGFMREKIPDLWNEVFLILIKYLTLEGRYGVFYYYHLSLLNYFHHHDFVLLHFFLLHELEDNVIDVKEKMRKGVNFTILHQGLMFRLYQFHLALVPPGLWR